jgi:glutamate/aspartate transport system substrate-binding protein
MMRAAIMIIATMLPMHCVFGAPPPHGETLAKIRNSGVIVIGHSTTSIPFSYLPSPGARPTGYSISICEHIVDAIRTQLKLPNLRIQYQPVRPENRISLLTNGGIDIECGATTGTTERRKEVDFSATIFVAATRVVVQKGGQIRSLRDLNGRKVAVTHGTTNEQILEDLSRNRKLAIELVRSNDHDMSYASMRQGRADAVAMDDVLLIGMINEAGDYGKVLFLDDTLSSEPYGVMMRKSDPDLKTLVDNSIDEMINQGVMAKLYMQWFRSPIPPKRVNLNLPFTAEMAKVLRLLPR